RMQSFLVVSADLPPIPVALTWANLRFALTAVILTVVIALLFVVGTTRRSLLAAHQRAAHPIEPWWQRSFLDVLLLVPTLYGLYQLRRVGGLHLGIIDNSTLLNNLLLPLVPVLGSLCLGLLALRGLPYLWNGLAAWAARTAWRVPVLALRALGRQPAIYRGPCLLLILTLSLATVSASLATTIAGTLRAALTYQVGAITQLQEAAQSTEQPSTAPGQARAHKDIQKEPRFLFVPVADHLAVPGITAVTRVGTYHATAQLSGANQAVQLIGLDRLTYPPVVAHFDPAWSGGQSLGALMNLLARRPEHVLVSGAMLAQGFKIGDELSAVVTIANDHRTLVFRIAGTIDLWPGYYPQDGPLIIANLDDLFDQMGGQYPYDVWIAHTPGVAVSTLVQGVRERGMTVVDSLDGATLVTAAEGAPQYQGVVALLGIGVLVAALLTLLGLLVTALITAERRASEFGILRALGLREPQLAATLLVEYGLLVVASISLGTGSGLLVAYLVVPSLVVEVGPHPGTPPYPPQIAWGDSLIVYLIFAAALLLAVVSVVSRIRRLHVFQAVKLGESE
ncbi:MAG: ABC transporter permease, partial [Herpetosiphonaceae bacterium]|nr:ABC transporter permease [Herpetosiphonaceae bacterium]